MISHSFQDSCQAEPREDIYAHIYRGDIASLKQLHTTSPSEFSPNHGRDQMLPPIAYAVAQGQIDIFDYFAHNGGDAAIIVSQHDADIFDDHLLNIAARHGQTKMLHHLMKHHDFDINTKSKETNPYFQALAHGHIETLDDIIKHGGRPHKEGKAQDQLYIPLLFNTAGDIYQYMADTMPIDLNACQTDKNDYQDGLTPLQWCIYQGKDTAFQALLESKSIIVDKLSMAGHDVEYYLREFGKQSTCDIWHAYQENNLRAKEKTSFIENENHKRIKQSIQTTRKIPIKRR